MPPPPSPSFPSSPDWRNTSHDCSSQRQPALRRPSRFERDIPAPTRRDDSSPPSRCDRGPTGWSRRPPDRSQRGHYHRYAWEDRRRRPSPDGRESLGRRSHDRRDETREEYYPCDPAQIQRQPQRRRFRPAVASAHDVSHPNYQSNTCAQRRLSAGAIHQHHYHNHHGRNFNQNGHNHRTMTQRQDSHNQNHNGSDAQHDDGNRHNKTERSSLTDHRHDAAAPSHAIAVGIVALASPYESSRQDESAIAEPTNDAKDAEHSLTTIRHIPANTTTNATTGSADSAAKKHDNKTETSPRTTTEAAETATILDTTMVVSLSCNSHCSSTISTTDSSSTIYSTEPETLVATFTGIPPRVVPVYPSDTTTTNTTTTTTTARETPSQLSSSNRMMRMEEVTRTITTTTTTTSMMDVPGLTNEMDDRHRTIPPLLTASEPTMGLASSLAPSMSATNIPVNTTNTSCRLPTLCKKHTEAKTTIPPVGSRVAVYWDGEERYFEGTITAERIRHNGKRSYSFIQYDDGDEEWVNLQRQQYYCVTPALSSSSTVPLQSITGGGKVTGVQHDKEGEKEGRMGEQASETRVPSTPPTPIVAFRKKRSRNELEENGQGTAERESLPFKKETKNKKCKQSIEKEISISSMTGDRSTLNSRKEKSQPNFGNLSYGIDAKELRRPDYDEEQSQTTSKIVNSTSAAVTAHKSEDPFAFISPPASSETNWVATYQLNRSQTREDDSSDSDTDEEELMQWAAKMFGISRRQPPSVTRPKSQPTPPSCDLTMVHSNSNYCYEEPILSISEKVKLARRRPLVEDASPPKKEVNDDSKENQKQRLKGKMKRMTKTNAVSSIPEEEPVVCKRKNMSPPTNGNEEDSERARSEEKKRKKEMARALTTEEIRAILGEDDAVGDCLASSTWVRRSVRQPSRNILESACVKALIDKLKSNDPEMVVLKMKKYINDPATPCVVIDAVLDALEENTNCQALYIQNFNEGMRDEQVMHLLRILQQPSCSIWCLNIGETYKVKRKTWKRFAIGLRKTKITHTYVSEHVISSELKDRIRNTIRDNRSKHSMHIDPDNLDVIVKCTHNWWNPINAKILRPHLKKKGYEHFLHDKEAQGLLGSKSGATLGEGTTLC